MHTPDDRHGDPIDAALRQLDHAPPPASAEALIRRAESRSRRPARYAAAVLAVLGLATAAFAFPGSPVARWARDAATRHRNGPAAVGNSAVAIPGDAVRSAIHMVAGTTLEISFEAYQTAGQLRLSFVPDSEFSVQAINGDAQYSILPNGLTVQNRGSTASYVVQVPDETQHLSVRVAGHMVFTKAGTRLAPDLVPDRQGVFVLPLSAAR